MTPSNVLESFEATGVTSAIWQPASSDAAAAIANKVFFIMIPSLERFYIFEQIERESGTIAEILGRTAVARADNGFSPDRRYFCKRIQIRHLVFHIK
jgi:hypothetical protein